MNTSYALRMGGRKMAFAPGSMGDETVKAILDGTGPQGDEIDTLLKSIAQDNLLLIPEANKDIDETKMTETRNECPKCGFQW
jgi:hypothetical protein